MEFKQYHDESTAFHHETMVYFSQCNDNKSLSLNELLKLTSDVAVEDFNLRNMSRDILTEKGYAILVSRCSFRIHNMPKENQHICVHTWEEKSEALQFVRSYEITDSQGNKLVSGLSSWLLVDVNSRRILPIKKFTLRQPTEKQTEHDCLPYGKISLVDDMEVWDQRIIKYSDIDGNGHTTNSRYAAFLSDALPQNLRHVKFTDFRINFAKEAMLGEELGIYGKIFEEEKKLVVAGKVGDSVSFEAELYW